MVAGRTVETAALVVSLRNFIREVLDLEAIPAELRIPAQGPLRTIGASGRAGRAGASGGPGGGTGGSGRGGMAGGGGSGAIGGFGESPEARNEPDGGPTGAGP